MHPQLEPVRTYNIRSRKELKEKKMAGEGSEGTKNSVVGVVRSLEQTPSWALATVFFGFITVSIIIEHLIHLLSNWFKRNRKSALFDAIEKLKSVLMVLGFMSLILTVTQAAVAKICVPIRYAKKMLPCNRKNSISDFYNPCKSEGKTSLMSEEGMNELSYFIFVLAAVQILYSLATLALGRAKMRKWKAWERETQTVEYQAQNDPNRFRLTRETTFARRHVGCTKTTVQLWIKCFFRQFFRSVAKVDYLILRHGFISAHLSNNHNFNFQKYIERSLDDDFKAVVGIRPLMWLAVVIFMLVDVHGWEIYLWISFLPLIIVLIVGTKLEVIVARMAIETKDVSTVTKGTPLVQPNDKHFWFSDPKFILTLLHYTLFLNAFEFAFFIWVTWQFGIQSCYHEHTEIIVIRVALAVTVQVLSSYITLPLYALVTQMGSSYKRAILEEHTAQAIRQWHARVREKMKKQQTPKSNPYNNENNNNHPQPLHQDSHRNAFFDFPMSHQRVPTLVEMAVGDEEIVEDGQQVPNQVGGIEVEVEKPCDDKNPNA